MTTKLTTPPDTGRLLISPNQLTLEQLEELENSSENIMVSLKDYTILFGKHKVCAKILRKTRSEKDQIEKSLTSEALSDHGLKIAIQSMKVMVAGMEQSLALLSRYKSTISNKKNTRPRISLLAKAMETIENSCPSVDMEQFMTHLKLQTTKTPDEILGKINLLNEI